MLWFIFFLILGSFPFFFLFSVIACICNFVLILTIQVTTFPKTESHDLMPYFMTIWSRCHVCYFLTFCTDMLFCQYSTQQILPQNILQPMGDLTKVFGKTLVPNYVKLVCLSSCHDQHMMNKKVGLVQKR